MKDDAAQARIQELEAGLTATITAMELQQGRDAGEFHISQPAAKAIWDEALKRGREALVGAK